MLIVGLTGSIGMGKSAIAAMLRERNIPVIDADAEVHRLYAGEAVPLVEAAFPGTTHDGRIDRARLAAALGDDHARFVTLERIIHPLVRHAERAFLTRAHDEGAPVAVLEIPLLYETGLDAEVDAVIVASAPPDVQRARVLARSGMSDGRLDALLTRQIPDSEKRSRADFIVDTGGTLADSEAQLDAILTRLEAWPHAAYTRFWQSD